MATPTEIAAQQKQAKAAKSKQIAAVTGMIAQHTIDDAVKKAAVSGSVQLQQRAASYQRGAILATVIDLISGIGIAAYSFLSQKKRAKKKERKTKNQAIIQSYVDLVLSEISNTGSALVDQGINPLSPEFEQQLYNNLFDKVGYRGHCNATVWVQNTKPEPNRPILFKATRDGRVIVPVTMQDPPNDLQTYWYSQCKGLKDGWVIAYQDLLIREGRMAELEELHSSIKTGQWILRGVFGVIFTVAIIFWVMNMRRIK